MAPISPNGTTPVTAGSPHVRVTGLAEDTVTRVHVD